jgi:hypothetical protein
MAARVDAVASWILSVMGADLAASPPPSIRPSPSASAVAASPPPAPSGSGRPYGLVVGVVVVLCVLVALLWWRGFDGHRGKRRARF